MSFFYNSINHTLALKNAFSSTTNDQLQQIQKSLSRDMICPYRRILNVYSSSWPSITQISRIRLSHKMYQESTSLIHDVQSTVIVRLLREWMTAISSVMSNIKAKLH